MKFSELPAKLARASGDITTYRRAGDAILAGNVPYRDFFIEYPPGSLPAFVPPALFATNREDYATLFASEMALVLVAALVLTTCAARALGRWWPLPAVVFTAAALLLYPVAVTRYDAIVALALAATVASAALGGTHKAALSAAWASLGFGAAAKLIPLLVILPLSFTGRREGVRTFGATAWGFVVFSLVAAAFFLPALLFSGVGFDKSFMYHVDRGLQLESLLSSVLMKLGWVEGASFEYGAFDVKGKGTEFLTALSPPITGVLLGLTTAVMYRTHRKSRLGSEQFPGFAAAFVLAFMLGSKVLSPQYVIWLLPLVCLSASGALGVGVAGIFLAICWMTTQIFRYHYGELIDIQSPATELLLGRNLLLVILWAIMLFLPSLVASRPENRYKPPGADRGR